MSAFLVSKRHIDCIITTALKGAADSDAREWYPIRFLTRDLTWDIADGVGLALWLENVVSVLHRYPKDKPEDYSYTEDYRFEVQPKISTVQALKLLHCFEYQSCEHDGWEVSAAKKFCESLAYRLISSHPEYSSAEWSVD